MARRQRRRLLQIIAMAFSGLLFGRPAHANTTRRQQGPLSQGQRMLIIEFLEAQATLLSTYVLAGIDDAPTAIAARWRASAAMPTCCWGVSSASCSRASSVPT